MRLALSKGTNRVGVSLLLHLKTETGPVSEMLFIIIFRTPDDGQSPETQ
jgi:hypothetical protein